MALESSNSGNLEQLALKGLKRRSRVGTRFRAHVTNLATAYESVSAWMIYKQ